MTTDTLWRVQTAVRAHLAADDSLTALLPAGSDGICDHVPAGTAFPYIVLSDMQAVPHDTVGGDGYEITLYIDSFSQAAGMKELKTLMHVLRARLHRAGFTVTGHSLVTCDEISAAVSLEADGRTRAGRQRFRLIVEPPPAF